MPATVDVSMNARIFTQPTRMPASDDPSMFAPVEIVWAP